MPFKSNFYRSIIICALFSFCLISIYLSVFAQTVSPTTPDPEKEQLRTELAVLKMKSDIESNLDTVIQDGFRRVRKDAEQKIKDNQEMYEKKLKITEERQKLLKEYLNERIQDKQVDTLNKIYWWLTCLVAIFIAIIIIQFMILSRYRHESKVAKEEIREYLAIANKDSVALPSNLSSTPQMENRMMQPGLLDLGEIADEKEMDMSVSDHHRNLGVKAFNQGRWEDAVDYFTSLLALTGKEDFEAHAKLGYCFQRLSEKEPDLTGKENFLSQAIKHYETAAEIDPNQAENLNNWGNAMFNLAGIEAGAESVDIYREACDKYQRATEINQQYATAFNNWGNTLMNLGGKLDRDEAIPIYQEACEKYSTAEDINPRYAAAFRNHVNALLLLVYLTSGEIHNQFLEEAKTVCLMGEEVTPGSCTYNLACIAALQDNDDECKEWLEKAHKIGKLPELSRLETDSDLESIQNKEWFLELTAQIRSEQEKDTEEA